MAKLFIERTASDNAYLHKDFHGALSVGIEYIHTQFGEAAVHRYLRQFATAYYAPLTAAMHQRGLAALKEHFERIYAIEGGEISIDYSEDAMTLNVDACPALTHLRANGYTVARLFSATSATVYATICAGTPFQAEILAYDNETGRSTVRFSRRTA